MKTDMRIPYGFFCTWWDSIDKAGNQRGLPVCPHCKGLLCEVPSIEAWWKYVDAHQANGNVGYRKMVEWGRGKCFRNYGELTRAYTIAMKGKN